MRFEAQTGHRVAAAGNSYTRAPFLVRHVFELQAKFARAEPITPRRLTV